MKNPGPICFRAIIRVIALACLFPALSADAHEPSKSYLSLTLDSGRFTGQWDIPLRDLQNVVPLGQDKNGVIAREQLEAHCHEATAYAVSRLQILLDGQARVPALTGAEPAVEELSDGPYLRLNFILEHFPPPRTIEVKYQLFFETNSLHRGLLRLEAGGKVQITAFSPGHSSQQFQLASPAANHPFRVFLHEGVWHIWSGYDHILFLLALLLPAVLRREAGQWRGVGALRPAFCNVLKIVTAFTLAHSLTLTLATLGVVQLPSRLTESAIAVSVMLAAGNNLWPLAASADGWWRSRSGWFTGLALRRRCPISG